MNNRNRRRKQKQTLKQISDIISAAALFIIAVLMVVVVILYISNNSILGNFFNNDSKDETYSETAGVSAAEKEEAAADDQADTEPAAEFGLVKLDDGSIVYLMDSDEASSYDEEYILDVSSSYSADDEDVLSPDSGERFYLINSWLDYNNNLYHFDESGYACRDASYSEGAFKFVYNSDAVLREINYNSGYSESSSAARDGYPGLVSTRTLWAFMDTDKTLGGYNALKYKKTTESLSSYLGGTSNIQYASPYAYDIEDGQIFYLAVPSGNNSGSDSVLGSIVGKVFCMVPGSDYREIAAENAYGFKVLSNSDWETVVYYYDGSDIIRNTVFEKDDNLVIFSEDASYTVDISSVSKAYLVTTGGVRVTLESNAFKSGNFTYSLSSEGEILSVASKKTVSMNGYTYEIENGTSFGTDVFRLIRTDSTGSSEIISSETSGSTGNIHYDYNTSSIIAEYESNSGYYGLVKISLDGDVDFLSDSRCSEAVELYAIQGGDALIRTTVSGDKLFMSVDISDSVPLSLGIDPVEIVDEETGTEAETIAPADYDTTNSETSADSGNDSNSTAVNSGGDIITSEGPGSVSISVTGPNSLSVDTVGPGGS